MPYIGNKTADTTLVEDNSITSAKIVNDAVIENKLNLISTSSVPSLEAKGDGSSQDGYIALNCSQNSHAVKIKSPPHSANQSYTLTLPSTAPATDKMLQTDGSGNLSFVDAPSGAMVKLAQVDNSTSSSTVSNITLDHFSTTYDYYKFYATLGSDTQGSDWRVRFRDGGSDVTNAYYIYAATNGQINSGGTSAGGVGLAAFFTDRLDFANDSTTSSSQKVVLDWTFSTATGNAANRLQLMGNTGYYMANDTLRTSTFRGFQNNQGGNFYEGFKIYLSSGNIRYYNYTLYGVVK